MWVIADGFRTDVDSARHGILDGASPNAARDRLMPVSPAVEPDVRRRRRRDTLFREARLRPGRPLKLGGSVKRRPARPKADCFREA